VPYCLARGKGQLYPMSSDTDIILERKDYQFFFTLLTTLQAELNFCISNIIKRYYVYTHILYLKEFNVYVQIDVEFDFDWWSFKIVNAKDILNRSQLSNSIVYASDIDSSFMKFYRSLLWGVRLSAKYKNTTNLFDLDFINNSTYLKAPSDVKVGELRNYYSSNVVRRVKKTRKSLVLTNLARFGLIKTLYRLFVFVSYEIRLLFSNNGAVLFIHGDDELINLVSHNLIKYITVYNAPFKATLSYDNISYLKKRKRLRDSYLLITETKSNVDFEICGRNNLISLKRKGVMLCEVKRNDFVVNNFIDIIYNY
jgi:hypothetical protein